MEINKTRRKFIQDSFLAITSLYASQNLMAKTEKSSDIMTYILISMYEAPPRWNMDLLLDPFAEGKVVANKMIGTIFKDVSNLLNPVLEMKYTKIKNINFPSIWNVKIPVVNNKWENFQWIANNMVNIRGCSMDRDGHDINTLALETQKVGSVSFSGNISDHSNRPITALGLCGDEVEQDKSLASAFLAKDGGMPISANNSQESYFNQIFKEFSNLTEKSVHFNQNNIENIRESFRRKITKESYSKRIKSLRVLKKIDMSKVESQYEDYLKKYTDLIQRSIRKTKIPGVTDIPIQGLKLPVELDLVSNEKEINPDDYLGVYKVDDYYVGNDDIKEIFSLADMPSLAHQFAMLEISLKYKLTHAHLLMIDPMMYLNFKKSYEVEKVKWKMNGNKVTFYYDEEQLYETRKTKIEYLNTDAHNVGTYVSTIGWPKFYISIMSCLNELLKNNENAFQNLLVHLTSEFEREPRPNASGSEHGWSGHTSTLISGKLKGPQVLGNIALNSNDTTDMFKNSGTWGKGAFVKELNRPIRYLDILTTMSDLIGISSSFGGFKLFEVRNGKILINIERARNV